MKWVGHYVGNDGEQHEMIFENLQITTEQEQIIGGGMDEDDPERCFDVSGKQVEGLVKFIKQYDGKWTHAVHYMGELQNDGNLLVGHWGYKPGENRA